eukprot:403375101
MGASCMKSNTVMTDKRVIIIGCSFAGLSLAEQLWDTHEVTIIDKNDFFEYICTGTRSFVDDDHFDEISVSYVSMMKAHSQRAEFVHGCLEEIFPEQNQILIRNGNTKELEFRDYDFLVLCTGASYQSPTKSIDVNSIEERKSKLALEQEAIKRAKSILVVGAGPVGVETVGDLVSNINNQSRPSQAGGISQPHISQKRIGIVSRAPTLLPHFVPKAQDYAMKFMVKNKVDVYLNTTYDENFKLEHQFDHVIMCMGAFYNIDYISRSTNPYLRDCLSEKGRVYVNNYLQVTNRNPLIKDDTLTQQQKSTSIRSLQELDDSREESRFMLQQKTFQNIFCFGDAAQTSVNEEKTVFPLKICSEICAKNIRALSTDEPIEVQRANLKQIPERFDGIYQISLGSNDGIMLVNNFVITGKLPVKFKRDYEELHMQKYTGDQKAKTKLNVYMKSTQAFLWACNTPCCQCCPCANQKRGPRPNDLKTKEQ